MPTTRRKPRCRSTQLSFAFERDGVCGSLEINHWTPTFLDLLVRQGLATTDGKQYRLTKTAEQLLGIGKDTQ
jgi:hypothetical protein